MLKSMSQSKFYLSHTFRCSQLITKRSMFGNKVLAQSLMVVMHTYPFGWKVQRLDQDFISLREYLIKKFPQVIIPPLPMVNQKKALTTKQLQKKKVYY